MTIQRFCTLDCMNLIYSSEDRSLSVLTFRIKKCCIVTTIPSDMQTKSGTTKSWGAWLLARELHKGKYWKQQLSVVWLVEALLYKLAEAIIPRVLGLRKPLSSHNSLKKTHSSKEPRCGVMEVVDLTTSEVSPSTPCDGLMFAFWETGSHFNV